jgi:putative Holliday junction resolvase
VSGRRLLAFDFGLRRIGVAAGHEDLPSGREVTTLPAREGIPDWQAVADLLAAEAPDLLIVGDPLTLEGETQEVTEAARRFGRRLHGRFGLPVATVDERLTSREARAELRERGEGDPAPERIDQVAARLILEDWVRRNETEKRDA